MKNDIYARAFREHFFSTVNPCIIYFLIFHISLLFLPSLPFGAIFFYCFDAIFYIFFYALRNYFAPVSTLRRDAEIEHLAPACREKTAR